MLLHIYDAKGVCKPPLHLQYLGSENQIRKSEFHCHLLIIPLRQCYSLPFLIYKMETAIVSLFYEEKHL